MKKSEQALLLVGAPDRVSDIVYASGFHAPDPVVVLRVDGRCVLVVSPLEIGRARAEAHAGTEVFTGSMLGLRRPRKARTSSLCLALLRKFGIRTIRVPYDFPHGLARELTSRGINVRAVKDPVFEERAVKTDEEVAHVKESQQAAVIAMRAATAAIAEARIDSDGLLRANGRILTSDDIRRLIRRTVMEHDCISRHTIVACGRQSADPHKEGSGPLRAHEPIVIDIFPQHMKHGYWGDITRTVVRGRASRRVRAMYHAVRAAQQAAMHGLKPGSKGSTAHRRAADELAKRGFVTNLDGATPQGFVHGTGHGVGLDIHEEPSLSSRGGWLKNGHVVTVEPGLYYPDIGGVRIEDTVALTSRGWRYLVPCEKRLEI